MINKIPVGIKSCFQNDERRIAIKNTWISTLDKNKFFPIFLIGRKNQPVKLVDNILYLDCEDSYEFLHKKTMDYLDWCLRETSSNSFWIVDDDSYINTKLFNSYDEYTNYDYSGSFIYGIDQNNGEGGYTSGSGYCLSRHIAESLPKDNSEFDQIIYEDKIIGNLINKYIPNITKLHISNIYPWSYCTHISDLMIGHYIHKGDGSLPSFNDSMQKMHRFYL